MGNVGRLSIELVGPYKLHPAAEWGRQYLCAALAAKGFKVVTSSGFRSYQDQVALATTGRTSSGLRRAPGAPVATPGLSPHNYGFGFDLNISPSTGYTYAGQLWEQLGGRWGGRFNDKWHFDLFRSWPTVAPLFARAAGFR